MFTASPTQHTQSHSDPPSSIRDVRPDNLWWQRTLSNMHKHTHKFNELKCTKKGEQGCNLHSTQKYFFAICWSPLFHRRMRSDLMENSWADCKKKERNLPVMRIRCCEWHRTAKRGRDTQWMTRGVVTICGRRQLIVDEYLDREKTSDWVLEK